MKKVATPFVAALAVLLLAVGCQAPATVTNSRVIPVEGKAINAGAVKGAYTLERFDVKDGGIVAIGSFTGSVIDGAGKVIEGTQAVTLPLNTAVEGAVKAVLPTPEPVKVLAEPEVTVPVVTPGSTPAVTLPDVTPGSTPGTMPAGPSCPILHLNLQPLNLNLLGLVVDLQAVVLDIVAKPGAGALLGNLLCAVTGLLDTGGTLTQIVAGLNSLLAELPLPTATPAKS